MFLYPQARPGLTRAGNALKSEMNRLFLYRQQGEGGAKSLPGSERETVAQPHTKNRKIQKGDCYRQGDISFIGNSDTPKKEAAGKMQQGEGDAENRRNPQTKPGSKRRKTEKGREP